MANPNDVLQATVYIVCGTVIALSLYVGAVAYLGSDQATLQICAVTAIATGLIMMGLRQSGLFESEQQPGEEKGGFKRFMEMMNRANTGGALGSSRKFRPPKVI